MSPAFDYENEWYDLEYRWLKSSPIRVQSPVVSPAFDYEDEWYDLEYWWLK